MVPNFEHFLCPFFKPRAKAKFFQLNRAPGSSHLTSLQASKCMKSLKLAQKGMQSALKELAVREAREAQEGGGDGKKFAFIHK